MNFVVAGGTGFLGKALVTYLHNGGHIVTVLSRGHSSSLPGVLPGVNTAVWDGAHQGDWERVVQDADAIVNLTGQSLDSGRWTRKRKEALLQSRVRPTRALIDAIMRAPQKPRVVVNASAVGYYPSSGDLPITEATGPAEGFIGQLCRQWEEEALRATLYGVRVVVMRMGVVLAAESGALPKMITPFRLYLGGPLGPGNQFFPWVHHDDVLRVVEFAATMPLLEGPVNVVAPQSVTMEEFSAALGKALQKPSWLTVPGFALRLVLGEMAETILSSQRVIPEKLKDAGYSFRYASLEEALASLPL
jgi:uncharacterized protein (TIGR01777 family)